MTDLTNLNPGASFGDLITLNNNLNPGTGLTNVLTQIGDGLGNLSPMQLSTTAVNFNTTGGATFQFNGVTLNTVNLSSLLAADPGFEWSETALTLPYGTTAQRPIAEVNGDIRFNTDTHSWEGWDGTAWRTFNVT